ncbi:MAG: hypothetical protein KKA99_00630 [Gammaproteobacteria bacterium]|nr:hypothetical protein [Gammaproteobacteria bacterium]MBU1558264.1 hypothetical protein [Gammaproteobacteria bacterium]MBU1629404.1 hypothetical protein [Gammaproteobacteria bacterium]MBU1926202.1 hypothetical protein [Gammaproteobacteria bacterium]MBU2545560.1 hypothetical protein [Gammaproteobacteria bacterium]
MYIFKRSLTTLALFIYSITALALPTSPSKNPPLQLLFIQEAKIAELTPMQQTGQYQLTLKQVSPRVIYFSDRPHRVVGQTTTSKFINAWNKNSDSFAKNNPNAALHYATFEASNKHGIHTTVYKLQKPVYNKAAHTLTYQVTPLQTDFALAHITYHDPVLFIDSFIPSCGVTCEIM